MSLSISVTYEPDGSPHMLGKSDRKLQLLVSRLQSGLDVAREVHKVAKGELKYSIDDYMLYWPERKIWIFPEKAIGLLRLEAGAKLEYRQKKRCIKLRFLDASSKLLIADETRPVKRLVEDFCEQLRIQHPEELSLVVAGDYAVNKHHPAKNRQLVKSDSSASPLEGHRMTLGRKEKNTSGIQSVKSVDGSSRSISPSLRRKRPGSGTGSKKWGTSKVKKQISKKHQIRLDTPWLDPNKTLAEQEVTEHDELILMYRFYYHMELQRGSANVEVLYKQARATYLAGELLCSPNDMVRLSALLCQITKGNYSNHKYSPDFLSSIKGLIAPPKCKVKAISKLITTQHSSLEGVGVADAKCWFVKLWSSLELFGMEFLSCTNVDTKEKSLVGVSKDQIMFLYHKNKKNTFWDIDKLTHWSQDVGKDIVTLTFCRDKQTEVLKLSLPDYSGVLIDCVQGHREVSDTVPGTMRAFTEYQFDDEMESAISVFATQTKRDAKGRRALNSLTYEDIYWASKIENPLLSAEELSRIKTDSWENPVFANMDQLMKERFSFLDFDEYSTLARDQTEDGDTSISTLSVGSSPQPHQRHISPHHSANSSPLTVSRREQSSTQLQGQKSEAVHNGTPDPLLRENGHSRKINIEDRSSDSGGSEGQDGEERAVSSGETSYTNLQERKDSNSGLSELTVR